MYKTWMDFNSLKIQFRGKFLAPRNPSNSAKIRRLSAGQSLLRKTLSHSVSFLGSTQVVPKVYKIHEFPALPNV